MALVESPLCSACGHESDDVEHALWSCPVLDRDVEILVQRLNESGIQDLSFDELVADRTAFFFLRDHVGGVLRDRAARANINLAVPAPNLPAR